MAATYLPIRIQRIWGQAIRVFLTTSPAPGIRGLSEEERGFLGRALNGYVQVREGTDPRIAEIVEASRDRIRTNEMSGTSPLSIEWFEKAAPYVCGVSEVYEALYDWYLAVKEYLDQQESKLNAEEMAGLRRVLPALIQSSGRTEDLDIDEIRDALLAELAQDPDFDIYYWTGTAMEYLGEIVEIIEDNEFSDRKTIPPVDPLPEMPKPAVVQQEIAVAPSVSDDTPSVEVSEDEVVPDRAPEAVVSVRTNALTGQDYEHFEITEDD